MTQNNVGIYASQISGHLWAPNGAYDALATVTVPSGGVASIEFVGIPQGYKHLEIRGIARTTQATTDANTNMKFNGDTGSNYNGHYLFGNGSGPASGGGGSASAIDTIRMTGANSTSGIFGAGVISILDYSNPTKNTTTRTLGGHNQNGSGLLILFSGLWINTAPVTSITLSPSGGNFAQYSQFALYGVK